MARTPHAPTAPNLARPVSATHALVAFGGFTGLIAGTALARWQFSAWAIHDRALLVMACSALGVFLPDLLWQRIWRAQFSAASRKPDVQRVLTKFAGLLGCLGFVAALYWLFPEYYRGAQFYGRYWSMLERVLPVWLLLAIPYLWFVDRHMQDPEDALWRFGRVLTGHVMDMRGRGREIGQLLLGWLVKGYFLPLMFTYLCNELAKFSDWDLTRLADPNSWFGFGNFILYYFDVALVSMTYLMSLRLTDTHIRSTEPTMFGWGVALICYQPFWSVIGGQYLDYDRGYDWGRWVGSIPWLYGTCATLILICVAIYVWATLSFGGRFSNLTHRGIITNGPYRFTRHPAYIAKNLSWWLVAMPFMVQSTWQDAVRRSLLLLGLNAVYWLRAKTEERHLSRDPRYVEYARWIEQHGALKFLKRVAPLRWLMNWQLKPLPRS